MSTPTFTKPHIRLPGGRPFHLLLTSLAVSSCGDWLYNVALLAFVYERTRSATWLAVTTAARVVPIVVLGPIGGVLADRWDRRRLIVASDLSRRARCRWRWRRCSPPCRPRQGSSSRRAWRRARRDSSSPMSFSGPTPPARRSDRDRSSPARRSARCCWGCPRRRSRSR